MALVGRTYATLWYAAKPNVSLINMDIEKRTEFYEKLYFHELESRNKIENRLRLPFAMFAIVFTMAGYLFNEALIVENVKLGTFFWTIYAASVIALTLSVGFFIKAWHGYTYLLLPEANVLEGYYQEILESYKKDYPKKSKEWASEAFQEYLLSTYSNYASHNTRNNDRKSEFVHKCIAALLVSFILACISYQPYYNKITQQTSHEQKESVMTDKPAPPPPPPPRNVKGEEPRQKPPKPEPKS